MYNDSLYHYGVKGMRWGVRRYRDYDGSTIGDRARKAGRNAAIGVGAAGALGVAALGGVAAKNPAVRKAIRRGITNAGGNVIDAYGQASKRVGQASKRASRAGKMAINETRNRAGRAGTKVASRVNNYSNQRNLNRATSRYNAGSQGNRAMRDYYAQTSSRRYGYMPYQSGNPKYGNAVRNAGLANTTKNTGNRQVKYMTGRSLRGNKRYY